MKQFWLSLLLLFTCALSSAQSIPAVKAKSLDGSEVTLPDSSSQQTLILIIGFSKKSGELCRVWGKKIAADYDADSRIRYFILPVLQGAPSLIRPMIVRGMRKSASAHELPHFVPLYSGESDWKRVVSFSMPDDAYLVVAAPDGRPAWQAHGSYSDSVYRDLKGSVAALLEGISKGAFHR